MQGAKRLTSLDASFLHLEAPGTHMHIGGVAVFEPSPHGSGRRLYEALLKAIEPRLDIMPRYRQKLAYVPLSLDIPVWVDDADFDIRNHVVRAHLPAPGGDDELQHFVARVFSRQLDRRRPLWELTVLEGLEGGRWALVSKTHHALVDGVSSLELATVLLDGDPEGHERPAGVTQWSADRAPSQLGLLLDSMRDRVTRPARLLSAARAVAGRPADMARALKDTASGVAVMAQSFRAAAPRGPINGPNGPARRYVYTRFPLADFRAVKNEIGGTINDVVLAAVTGGLRRFLLARGVDPTEEQLKALCPVSLRDESQKTALGNRLGMLLVDLPIDIEEPVARMRAVRATVDRLKARKQAVGAEFLLNLAGFAPATLHAMVARSSLQRIGFNLVVTNVPGPQFPLYCQGSQLVEAFPVAFLYEGQQVAVAIFSYMGWLNFGFLADAHGMPDVDVLAEGVQEALAELVDAARSSTADGGTAPRQRLHVVTGGAGDDAAPHTGTGGAAEVRGTGSTRPAGRRRDARAAAGSPARGRSPGAAKSVAAAPPSKDPAAPAAR